MKFNRLIPELVVADLGRSINFYVKILGFKKKYSREKFTFLSFEGNQIMISENDSWNTGELKHPFGRGINFQMEVKNIELILKSLKSNKYKLFRQPEKNWYRKDKELLGNHEFLVQDPDGYLLRFFESLGKKKIK